MRVDREREFVLGFIALYRELDCLWYLKGRNYSNKILRQDAHEKLLAFSKPYFADANVDWVRKKIANLRTVFLKEHKKIEGSKRSGSGSDQVYTPNLWYYNELLFLMEKEPQNQSLVIMSAQESAAVDEEGEASSLTLMVSRDIVILHQRFLLQHSSTLNLIPSLS